MPPPAPPPAPPSLKLPGATEILRDARPFNHSPQRDTARQPAPRRLPFPPAVLVAIGVLAAIAAAYLLFDRLVFNRYVYRVTPTNVLREDRWTNQLQVLRDDAWVVVSLPVRRETPAPEPQSQPVTAPTTAQTARP